MATIIIASITSVPLLLLVWDLATKTRRNADQYAGPARTTPTV